MQRFALILSLAATPAAGELSLTFPVDCKLDTTCYIQQFVDHDPSNTAHDFACGTLTYDGHKGTDFAVPTIAAQAAGVNILAAADGTVLGTRDEMPDILQIGHSAPDVTNRECGNGLVIQHADGFETQYCHMALGSVVVRTGQLVTAGTVLGQIGLSGKTQFPHLHFSVRKNGKVIDPFNTDGTQACPDTTSPSLWKTAMATPAGGIVSLGITDEIPDFDAIKQGSANTGIKSNSAALVGWSQIFGGRSGDTVTTTITQPSGIIFSQTDTLTHTQAILFRAFGKRTPQGGWPVGGYHLNILHQRGDQVIDTESIDFFVN